MMWRKVYKSKRMLPSAGSSMHLSNLNLLLQTPVPVLSFVASITTYGPSLNYHDIVNLVDTDVKSKLPRL